MNFAASTPRETCIVFIDIEPDLFGGVLLMKGWGRIGAHGRMVAERYDNEVVSTGQRIDYCFMSKSLTEFKGLDWIRKNYPLPVGSPTHVLSAQPDSVRRADRNDGTSNLQDWFGGPLSIEISEDAVGLGSYGKTLTVLYGIDLPDEDEPEEDEGLIIESWTPRFRR